MNSYKCSRCKTIVTFEKREHLCKRTRSIHGKSIESIVLYVPNYPKPNKQSIIPGYSKRKEITMKFNEPLTDEEKEQMEEDLKNAG